MFRKKSRLFILLLHIYLQSMLIFRAAQCSYSIQAYKMNQQSFGLFDA